MDHFRPMLAIHDVTEQQWRVIRILAEAGTLNVSEMANHAFIRVPSLTGIIRSLEARGFLTKTRDEQGGCRILLRIAPAASISLSRPVLTATQFSWR